MDTVDVLVVEPERGEGRRLASCLRDGGGLSVAEADGFEAALARLEEVRPELVVTAAALPGRSGYELCRVARGTGHDDVPFVFCSAAEGLPERVPGLRLGTDAWLVEPFADDALRRLVQQALHRRRRVRELQALGAQPERELAGTLGEIGVADLLQLLDLRAGGDACLEVAGPHAAEIYTRDRELVHAVAGSATGPKALLRILSWATGTFRLVGRVWAGRRTLSGRIDHALFDASAEVDEIVHLRERLGAAERLAVAHGPHLFRRRLGQATAEVLRLVELHGALEQVLDAAPRPDSDVLRVLIELMEGGLVVAEAGAPGPASAAEAAPAASPVDEDLRDALRDLRAQYVAGSAERLAKIAAALAALETDPSAPGPLKDALLGFHGFAGSGATYGFPTVSGHASDAENRCLELVRAERAPRPHDLATLARHLTALQRAFAEGAAEPAGELAVPAPARVREVLVLSPDPAVNVAFERAGLADGYRVAALASPEAALAALRTGTPDAVVVDDGFGDEAGYALVRRLRDLPGGESVAVLVLRAPGDFLDKVEAVHAGADAVLEKPVPEAEAIAALRRLVERHAAPPGRILAVEDDPIQSAFYETVLRAAGYEVRVCEEPRRLEAELAAFGPDLVLMDVVLPGADGYDLVRYMRQDQRWATLPILFVTTQAQTRARLEAIRAGGDDFLVKPVLAWLLVPAVAARIERARQLKSLIEHDGLTRLLVHSAFLERAQSALAQAGRDRSRSLALVMIDIDALRAVNQQHGHLAGDRVLAGCAALLRRRLRRYDVLGRYSGDEIAFVLDDLQARDAVRLVTRLRDEFASLRHAAGGGETVQASFVAGIAMLDVDRMDLDAWLQAAEDALEAARRAGPGAVELA